MIGGDKREYGPVEAELIRNWVREGRANGETLLRAEGETDWKPLRAFADFQNEFTAPAPVAAEPSIEPAFVEGPRDVRIGVGHAFARAWHLIGQHFGTVAAASFLVWIIITLALLPAWCLGVPAMLVYGPLVGGLFMLFLKLIREGSASPMDVFALTRDSALTLMMTGFVGLMLTEIGLMCCCVVPGIYLHVAWLLSLPLVADRGLGFWDALETSRRVATQQWFKMFALFIVSFLPVLVFHIYMTARMGADLSPFGPKLIEIIQRAIESGRVNETEMQKISAEVAQVRASYGLWGVFRQVLLLVSLPFGIGSLAFVYEDLFGRKK